ncbi:MAG: 50S ribosomal protein L1 [Candidatus Berkelbacteria bacterium]|nr:50S ribosomal protein L1 [Candidatus Berkelbacteria bacterium]
MAKEDAKKVKKEEEEIVAEETVELSEAEILKQAEEREKERKAAEKAEKEAQKEEEKERKAEQHEEKVSRKKTVRVKPRHSKTYRKLAEKIEIGREYPLSEAVTLALETNPTKFDATVEMHVKLNEKEKNIRGMVVLPGGVTKEKKVLEVIAENVDEVIANVKAGKLDFDIMIADIKVMPKLAQLAKLLGPKGLMPSPKAGTVVEDVKKAAAELKGGKVEFRADKQNIVHMSIGKISFGDDRIKQNFQAILDHLPKRIDSIYLTTSMGPSIKVAKK